MKENQQVNSGTPKYEPIAMRKEQQMERFPIEDEPRIPTMDKPLIIESACPGWQVGGERFPAVPISIEDQVKEQVESVKAGAIAVHVHPRDPNTGEAQMDPKLLQVVLDGIFDNVGDCITLTHSWYPVRNAEMDYIHETRELLELGEGNKYVQGSIILPIGYYSHTVPSLCSPRATIEGVKWMEANYVKPIYLLMDTASHLGYKQHLFDQGVSTWKPYLMNLCVGSHHSHTVHHDPWSYLQLITSMNMVKETIPDIAVGLHPGGRNWMPMVVMAILMGVDFIRVGIEDCYWLWPHKDEIIKKHSDVVKMTVEIANILGRRVVTDADEARKILGLKLTSKL